MQGKLLRAPRRLALAAAAGAIIAVTLALGGGATAQTQAQDRDFLKLRDQLRDCRGDDCVPIREQMMIRLRDQLQSCSGGQCDQFSDQLQLHEQVRDCHSADATCRQLRMEERERVRMRFHYGMGN